jgi:hypothetical protein
LLSSTLSRTSSGLDSRQFLKLFTLAVILLLIYLPAVCYFFYTNIPDPFVPYSWSRIHNSMAWDQILYLHTADFPDVQYWPWVPVGLSYILFFWYGFSHEAIECYRNGLILCGFANYCPILKRPHEPRRRNRSNISSRKSWLAKFDFIERTVVYLDGTKNRSQTGQDEEAAGSACGSHG